MSQSHIRVESLDVLRSIAVLLVFLSHYGIFASDTLFRSVGQYGWAGVDLFFVLGGYLIASQLLKPVTEGRRPSLQEFYFRRSLRILPSYFAVLLLYWVFPHWRERVVMASPWRFLTFTANFGLDFKHGGAFSHAWSLCVEDFFATFALSLAMSVVLHFAVERPFMKLRDKLMDNAGPVRAWPRALAPEPA